MRTYRILLTLAAIVIIAATGTKTLYGQKEPLPCGDKSTTIVVSPSDLQGWQQQHAHCSGGSSTGSQAFVFGPSTPPLGAGSLQFTIGADGDSFETVRYPNLDGVRIDLLTALSYSTFVTNFNDGQAPYLLLDIDFNGDSTVDDQIFFEPVYQSAAFFPPNPQGPPVEGQWQTWDAFNGGWWSLNNICGAGPGVNVKSLAQYLSCQPDARIINTAGQGGFRVATGCGGAAWAGFDGNIDGVLIGIVGNCTTFNFEPDIVNCPTCPDDIVAANTPGQCGAVVNYPAPTGCKEQVTCSPASGSFFPVGATTVNCSASKSNCSFTVTIQDAEGPTITCPPNITQPADKGQCSAVVNYPTPMPSDNCGCGNKEQRPGSPNGSLCPVTCSPASGSTFPAGTTTVTCTATDTHGNEGTCSFTVMITETQPPTITCPANVSQPADPNQCSAVVTYPAPTTNDNCPCGGTVTAPNGAASCPATCSPASGSIFPKGTTTVTCTATDASGNTASCSFTVTVNDTQPPTITCPANITKGNDPNQCGAVVNYPSPSVSDNCPMPGAPMCSPGSGSFFPVGTTTVTCTVADMAGNSAMCTFTITVNDTQPPTITCPPNQTAVTPQNVCASGSSCSVVSFPAPVASDNCPGTTVVCNPPSGSCLPVGTTTVTCTATDASGNTASCSFSVGVFDACLQDDANPSTVLLFNTVTGDYRFCCLGVTYTGKGKVTRQGCVFTLEHNTLTLRVRGVSDKAVFRGNASVQSPPGKIRCNIADGNIRDNNCVCQ